MKSFGKKYLGQNVSGSFTVVWPELSLARTNLNKSKKSLDFYYHSIKVHTQEAQNLHQLKSSLSDPNKISDLLKKTQFLKIS
jgi:hypothetical protein